MTTIIDIDGVGPAAVDRLTDAQIAFFDENKGGPAEASAAWRDAKIGELFDYGFVATDLQPLAAAKIHTAGELYDFTLKKQIGDLAGLAPERIQAVRQALNSYMKAQGAEKAEK